MNTGDASWFKGQRRAVAWRCAAWPCIPRLTCLLAAVSLLTACIGSSETGEASAVPFPDLSASTLISESADGDIGVAWQDPRDMTYRELISGPGLLDLDVVELFRVVGVVEFLENYIINIPTSASFIAGYEISRAQDGIKYIHANNESAAVAEFENRLLVWAYSLQLPFFTERSPEALHEAFFDALEECGTASPWPDVELFVVEGNRGGEVLPDIIESNAGLSYFEFQQIKHRCARYATTYPTLDPVVRDELLAPQRAQYAEVILDRLDNELPPVEVPLEYQAEVDDLRRNGW